MSQLVSDIGEFGLIERITKIIGSPSSKTRVGIGDDAATLMPIVNPIVVTTDAMIEGVHFRCDWSTPEEVAHKALACNISDLAAKAALPLHFVISLGLPFDTKVEWVERFYQSLAKHSHTWEIDLVGGDTVKAQQIVIAITAWGSQTSAEPIQINEAKPGDSIFVTGTLGDSAAGLTILQNQVTPDKEFKYLTERFHAPQPRHLEALGLLQLVTPNCMTDISDGLAQDLKKICRASRTGAIINTQQLPISDELQNFAGNQALSYAVRGGEDYELLFTLPPDQATTLQQNWSHPCPITQIGEIRAETMDVKFDGLDEQIHGFDHFQHNI